ncbi:MAG: twitching motility protein PilT [Desulfobacteraceae bacterium IS3]|nr:MAG: twitching motility protein PilT [Desulfobacteraceae bacterium IS3]
MKILLDTCTFLWLVLDAPELTVNARTIFSDSDNHVYLSAVSVWEIAVKNALGKLTIPSPADSFIREQRLRHEIDELPLDESSVLHLPKLPNLHRDPFDRMLVCQAVNYDMLILTPDPIIRKYPVRVIW